MDDRNSVPFRKREYFPRHELQTCSGAHSMYYPLCSLCSLGPSQCPIHCVPCIILVPTSVLSTVFLVFFGAQSVSYSLRAVYYFGPNQCPIHCVPCVLWGPVSVLFTACRVLFWSQPVFYPLCSLCSLGPAQCPIHCVPCVLLGAPSVLCTMCLCFLGPAQCPIHCVMCVLLEPTRCPIHRVQYVLSSRIQRPENDAENYDQLVPRNKAWGFATMIFINRYSVVPNEVQNGNISVFPQSHPR
jgi:hypothetical protein